MKASFVAYDRVLQTVYTMLWRFVCCIIPYYLTVLMVNFRLDY